MEDNKEEVVSSSSSHRRARSSVKREVNGHVPAGEKKAGLGYCLSHGHFHPLEACVKIYPWLGVIIWFIKHKALPK